MRIFLSILFLFHPALIESYAWLTNIKDLLAVFTILILSNFYLSNRETIVFGSKNFLIYNVLVIIAFLTKPTNIFIPFVFFLVDVIIEKRVHSTQLVKQSFAILLSICLVLITVYIRNSNSAIFMLPHYSITERVAVALNNWLMYSLSVLFPYGQSIFYPYPFKPNQMPPSFYFTFLIPIIILYLLIKKQNKISLIILIGLMILSPVLQLIPVGESVRNDRYSSVYVIFLLIVCGFLFKKLTENRKKIFVLIVYGIVISFSINIFMVYFIRIKEWKSVENILLSDYSKYSNNEIVLNTLGVYYLNNKQLNKSIILFEKALKFDKQYVHAMNNLAKAYYLLDNIEKSKQIYLQSIKMMPFQYEPYKNLAIIHYEKGNYQIADSILSIHLLKTDAVSLNLMGKIKYNLGHYSESLFYQEAATSIERNPNLLYDLAVSYGALRDFEKSLSIINECIELRKDFADAYFLRGIVLYNLGLDPCPDLKVSRSLGYKDANKAIAVYCSNH